MTEAFRSAHAGAEHWGLAAKACLDRLGGVRSSDNIGFLYVTHAFAGDIASIVTFLRETTGLATWVGGAGFGVFETGAEIHHGGAVALMVGRLPAESLRLFAYDEAAAFLDAHALWLRTHPNSLAVVHGDPRRPATAELVGRLAELSGGFLVGGLTAAAENEERVAGRPSTAALSGVFLGGVSVAVGLTQGCSPIGGIHTVTETMNGVIMRIDDRLALEVLREEAGELIARDLRRAAGYIHVAQPVPGSDTGDYTVRNLTGIDPRRGWLAVGAELSPGDPLLFVRRDANAAQRDMRRMLGSVHSRVSGRVLGALYVSCVARGPHMFGTEGRELALIEQRFGAIPLVGFSANGEICGSRLYAYTGVLAVFHDGGAA